VGTSILSHRKRVPKGATWVSEGEGKAKGKGDGKPSVTMISANGAKGSTLRSRRCLRKGNPILNSTGQGGGLINTGGGENSLTPRD